MDLGTTLRTARERRGLSLAQLASTTKIPVSLLAALEDNAFDRVPRGIFVRGYLRAYAREVGLESDAVIDQFRAETGEAPPPIAGEPRQDAQPLASDEIDDALVDPDLSGSGPGWGYMLIVAALLVAVISVNRDTSPDAPAIALNAATLADQEAGAVDRQPPTSDLQPVATVGDGLRFELQARGPCWVEAIVDGRRVVYRLMQPGEHEALDGEREIVLRIGDPGALTYSLNGRVGEPLGTTGIPVTIRFTREGERQQLAS